LTAATAHVTVGPRTKRAAALVLLGDGAPEEETPPLVFPLQAPVAECTIRLYDENEESVLGEWQGAVGPENDSTQWCDLSPEGEMLVAWGYKYDAAADPGARALGTLSVEVVKARDLPVSEFGEPPTTRCRIVVGGHEVGTRLRPGSAAPQWNETFGVAILDAEDDVGVAVVAEDGTVVGTARLPAHFAGEGKKGSEWLPLRTAAAASPAAVLLRYKYVPQKRKTLEVPKTKEAEVIVLRSAPQLTGSAGYLPLTRVYAWHLLLHDAGFRRGFVPALLAAHVVRTKPRGKGKAWTEAPAGSVDAVVLEVWRCETRGRLFNETRSAATEYLTTGTCTATQRPEYRDWYRWKETAFLAAQVAQSDPTLDLFLRAAYHSVMYGTERPTDRQLQDPRPLTKAVHHALCQHVYCALVPGLSRKAARGLATEDYARYDGAHGAGIDDKLPFTHLIKELVSFWCETVTAAEYRALVSALVPLLATAHQELRARSGADRKRNSSVATTIFAFPDLKLR